MRRLILLSAGMIVSFSLFAQQEPPKGAKVLFLDTQSGRMTMPKVSRSSPKPSSNSLDVPAITGLMYYLELVTPSGELVRVNSNRTFRSGEKFRLHVSSNIDGWLTILQSQDGGRFEKLFPTSSLPGSASNIRKGVDTVLPAAGGWFKFDERPGEIRLLMMLTAEEGASSMQVASGRNEVVESMLAAERLQRGSKALLIETSDSPKEGFEVRVVNSTEDRKIPPGQIVVELKLEHRPRV